MIMSRFLYVILVVLVVESAYGFVPTSNSIATATATVTAPTPRQFSQQSSSIRIQGSLQSVNNRHSASDWLYNLKTLPNSSVLKETRNPVLSLTVWATGVSLVHKLLLACGKSQVALSMCVPHVAHSFVVSSLGLLLVFRTNSAYQRFQEGRQIWEQILTTSRNFSRMATLYRSDVGTERLTRIKNLVASFPYLLRHHVRSGCLCSENADRIDESNKVLIQDRVPVVDSRYEGDKASGGAYSLEQYDTTLTSCYVDRRNLPWSLLDDPKSDTILKVAQAANRPLWVCDRIGKEIMGIQTFDSFSSRERLSLLGSIDKLTSAIGQCERINQTAVPLNYARHALRSLTLWLVTLPFCLVKDLGFLTGPATGICAWLLFGVYQIGHSIEDPFQGSLRLSMLCDHIRRDVLSNEYYNEDEAYLSLGLSSSQPYDEDEDDEDDYDFEDYSVFDKRGRLSGQVGDLDEELDMIFPKRVTTTNSDLLVDEPRLVLQNGAWNVVGVDQ